MSTAKEINQLWDELRGFVDRAASLKGSEALNDYRTVSSHWDMQNLLDRETANERKHRNGYKPHRFVCPISSAVAAKLILCGNFAEGSKLEREPSAVEMLIFRHTAVEMTAIGWLCRSVVTNEWRERLSKLDYAQIMRAA